MDEESSDSLEQCCADWKEKILAIDDPKELEFIRDLCSARMQIGDAENRRLSDSSGPSISERQKDYNPLGIKIESDDPSEDY